MIPSRTFFFLRHGQTDWNRDGRYQGTSDTPLNETGMAQANAAASAMATVRINRIVASPLIRALKTAEIVAEKIGVPICVDRDLRERHFGSFESLVIKEVKQKHGLPLDQSSRSNEPGHAGEASACAGGAGCHTRGRPRGEPVDLRIVAATHHDLPKLVEAQKFRQDLYFRLNVLSIHIRRRTSWPGPPRRSPWACRKPPSNGCKPMPGREMFVSCAT
jgi:Histidine phosphatase superfamily (branch 1)/Sigma-54 interaction domain